MILICEKLIMAPGETGLIWICFVPGVGENVSVLYYKWIYRPLPARFAVILRGEHVKPTTKKGRRLAFLFAYGFNRRCFQTYFLRPLH
jgi:hypothetical protein